MFITRTAWAPHLIVIPDTDLSGREFKEEFNGMLAGTMEAIDAYLAKRKRAPKG